MNTITIIGNIGNDAETRFTQSGKAVTSFSIASNDGTKDKPRTVWFRCALWGDYGQKLCEYLTKGTLVAVTGRIDQEPQTWTAKDGTARASLEVTGDRVRLLSGGNRDAAPDAVTQAPHSMDDVSEVPF